MSHFAKIENNIVTEVIVAEQDFINSGAVGDSFYGFKLLIIITLERILQALDIPMTKQETLLFHQNHIHHGL